MTHKVILHEFIYRLILQNFLTESLKHLEKNYPSTNSHLTVSQSLDIKSKDMDKK